MSSFKIHTKLNEKSKNISHDHIKIMTTKPLILTNDSDDFGEDFSINIKGVNVIIPANTSKLHNS